MVHKVCHKQCSWGCIVGNIMGEGVVMEFVYCLVYVCLGLGM